MGSMFNLKRLSLSVLALIPVSTIALASESKLTDLDNEGAKNEANDAGVELSSPSEFVSLDSIDEDSRKELRSILPPLSTGGTVAEARARFQSLNLQLTNDQLESNFNSTVAALKAKGLISINESKIIPKPTSP